MPFAEAFVATVRAVIGGRERAALHEPRFEASDLRYVADCIETGWVSSVGSYVDRFETMLAEISGTGHAVATMNGTAALHAALIVAGVRPGDEVLIPSLTFIATANAASYAGATPHFVDCGATTLGVDPAALADYLDDVLEATGDGARNRHTGAPVRAIVPMHVFGHPVDMDALGAVADRWGLVVIEDAAEALGSTYHGRRCGGLGRLGVYSFNGNKVVTTGGGGAIVTADPALARAAKHLTTTARVPGGWNFVHDRVGFNYRLPNLNAALGCAQLERLPALIARKRALAARYIAAFDGLAGASIVAEPAGCESIYWLVTARLDRSDAVTRDAVLTALNDNGLMARPIWTPMHRLPMYAACPAMPLPNTDAAAAALISLPSSPFLLDA